jgi:hypothetical protein
MFLFQIEMGMLPENFRIAAIALNYLIFLKQLNWHQHCFSFAGMNKEPAP